MMETCVHPRDFSCDSLAIKVIRWQIFIMYFFLGGLFGSQAYAEDTSTASEPVAGAEPYPKRINFRNILQNIDLAVGEVESILQDHDGFMWLSGRNALLRYDGYEFQSIYT